jgi:hypothetical protein
MNVLGLQEFLQRTKAPERILNSSEVALEVTAATISPRTIWTAFDCSLMSRP